MTPLENEVSHTAEDVKLLIDALERVAAFEINPSLSDSDLTNLAVGNIGQRSDMARIGVEGQTPFRDNAWGLRQAIHDARRVLARAKPPSGKVRG